MAPGFDLYRRIDAEGGAGSGPHHDGYSEALDVALKHVEALGYHEGDIVPSKDEVAGLRAALSALLNEIDTTSTFEGWSEGHKPLADKLDSDVLDRARALHLTSKESPNG